MEKNVDRLFNTAHRDAITVPILNHTAKTLQGSLDLFPYELTKHQYTLLRAAGIGVNNCGSMNHDHPVHKSIEQHLLYKHWASLADEPSSILYMKPQKFDKLKQLNRNFVAIHNYYHVPKDINRYPSFSTTYPSTPVLFIHDAIMYMSFGQVADLFFKNPSLKRVYASCVVPAESLLNLPSFQPAIYKYRIVDDQMHYTLERNPTAGYIQPASCKQWLTTSTFVVNDRPFNITVLDSWLSQHSLLITPGFQPDDEIVYPHPDAVALPQPLNSELPLHQRLVPRSLYDNLFMYARAVRTFRESDSTAFVRSVKQDDEYAWVDPIAFEQLVTFVNHTFDARPNTIYKLDHSFLRVALSKIKNFLLNNLPTVKQSVALMSIPSLYCLLRYGTLLKTSHLVYLAISVPTVSYFHHLKYYDASSAIQRYNEFFHPAPFRLAIKRSVVHADPQVFYPSLSRAVISLEPSHPDSLIPSVYQPLSSAHQEFAVKNKPKAPLTSLKQSASLTDEPSHQIAEASQKPLIELSSDDSATGPSLPFNQLFPELLIPENQGTFLSRRRKPDAPVPPTPSENVCLFRAIQNLTPYSIQEQFKILATYLPNYFLVNTEQKNEGFSTDHITILAWSLKLHFVLHTEFGTFEIGPSSAEPIHLFHKPGHWDSDPKACELTPASPNSLTPLLGGGIPKIAQQLKDFKMPDGTILPFKKIHAYHTVRLRASNLSKNMRDGYDGIVSTLHDHKHADFFKSIHSVAEKTPLKTVHAIHLAGFAGCGKSEPIKHFIRKYKKTLDYKVVVPSVELRSEWKTDLRLKSQTETWRVSTWEVALKYPCKLMVIDEIYKLPNGYLDLAALLNPFLEVVVILGDQAQGTYHSNNPASTNHHLIPEVHHLAPYRDVYCLYTYRSPKIVADLFMIKSFSNVEGTISHRRAPPEKMLTLVTTQAQAKGMTDAGKHAITIASSQGLTINAPVCINVDRFVKELSRGTSLVALTRSKTGIVFSGAYDELSATTCANSLFNAFHLGEKIPFTTLFANELQGSEIITEPMTSRLSFSKLSGASSRTLFDHSSSAANGFQPTDMLLNSPPCFDAVIPEKDLSELPPSRIIMHASIQSSLPSDATPQSAEEPQAAVPEPAYYGIDYEVFAASKLSDHLKQIDKEISYHGLKSNQFPYLNRNYLFGTAPTSLVAPIHNQKHDPTLLIASLKKRLRFRPNASPYHLTDTDLRVGQVLFESWCSAHKFSPEDKIGFDPILFAECINLNDYAQLSKKSQATLKANACRSDPDWRHTFVRIFAKNQHKLNSNNIFGDWKACQTLALMQDSVILTLGPVKKYQRLFFQKSRCDNIFILGGNTPMDLMKFVQKKFVNADSVENDYTAFDQSQLGEALYLEVKKMELLSIPASLIDFHVNLKKNLSCQFGELTCMRFTGEPGTYDDNSDYNLAVLYTLFNITDQAVLVSGDDSCINPRPPFSDRWQLIKKDLALQFKLNYTKYPLFCSYYLHQKGIVRAPDALFYKLMIAQAEDELDNKLLSYLSEFALGHSLGDFLWEVIPPYQRDFQAALFDFFCRRCNKNQKFLLKMGLDPLTFKPFCLLSQQQRKNLARLSPDELAEATRHEIQNLQGLLLKNSKWNSS